MPKGIKQTAEADWQERMRKLLGAISTVQARRHTVSLRELEETCGVSRQTVANWLMRAEELGYLDRHSREPRAVQLLPLGLRTLDQLTDTKARKVANERRQPDQPAAGIDSRDRAGRVEETAS